MPDILADVITHLKSDSSVTDLVGAGTSARIYSHAAKQSVSLPYLIIEVSDGESFQHLGGISGLARNRLDIWCYESTSAKAYTLQEVVRISLQMQDHVVMGNANVSGVSSDDGYRRGYDPPVTGSNQRRYWTMRTYLFSYGEATA